MAEETSSPPAPPRPENREKNRTFWALNGVMFQGALSDNIFKLLLIMLVIQLARQEFPGSEEAATARAGIYQQFVEVAFIFPFVIAVSLAGWLSDRFSKVKVTRGTKIMEIGTMILATLTLALGHPWLAVLVLFLMGLQSALFSPSKYGILPEILTEGRVAWGNGILQGWTFLAIIVGTIVGPWIYGKYEKELWVPGVVLVALAMVGYGISRLMEVTPQADPTQKITVNPWPLVSRYGREIWDHVGLKWSVFGTIVWWLVAVMCQGAAILIAQQILGLSPQATGIALLPIVVGIGLGCILTGVISRNRIEMGLVPFGALAMFATCLIVWLATPDHDALQALSTAQLARLKVELPLLMGLVGLVCGFFIVPLQSFILQESDPSIRGGVWATNNVLTALGMVVGSIVKGQIVWATASPGDVFLVGGLLMLAAGIVICLRFPMIPLRFFALVVFRGLYRVRVTGAERIPAEGGALLASNHQSYLDAVLIGSLTSRPVCFLMADDMYNRWYLRPLAKLTGAIPISRRQSVREMLRGLQTAAAVVREGGLVAIFPEGELTRTGMMLPFRRGVERIMKDQKAPVIPLALDGPYDTAFALRGGRMQWRLRSPFRRTQLNVAIGEPLPPNTPPAVLRKRVMDLMVDSFAFRKEFALPMHRDAVRGLRRKPFVLDFADHSTEGMISRAKMLAAIVALGDKLRPYWKAEEKVGILLPPSIGATAVNVAASLAGRITVNLNYTASLSILQDICIRAEVRLLVTSRAFLQRPNSKSPRTSA
jgi:acyl-[acyl-carrier-protein]-phospholipid O-acyltransferase/long-chain-fatty-acid--[acyl-carrier-protein] ligase